MPWFKIDDGFWSHPKVLELSDGAVALWVRAGSYCAGHLTDGVVKKSTLRVLGSDRDAATELVIAGLWDIGGDAWSFHDWEDYQPTREEVLAERAAATERKRRSREKSRGESRVTDTVTNGGSHSPPSRPVPSRPDQLTDFVSQSEDERMESLSASILTGLGIDSRKLTTHIAEKTGRQVTVTAAKNIAVDILGRGQNVSRPQAYVLGAITRSPSEAREWVEAQTPTRTPKRQAECELHTGWPLPCDKCATIAAEESHG